VLRLRFLSPSWREEADVGPRAIEQRDDVRDVDGAVHV
jgi:hypothetical protein